MLLPLNPPFTMTTYTADWRRITIVLMEITGTSNLALRKSASPVQTSRLPKRWLRRNGTSHVPYGRMALPKREVDVPYGNMAPPERDKHFVNVIVRVSPLRLTRSFAKEAQDDKTQFLFPAPCSLPPFKSKHIHIENCWN